MEKELNLEECHKIYYNEIESLYYFMTYVEKGLSLNKYSEEAFYALNHMIREYKKVVAIKENKVWDI